MGDLAKLLLEQVQSGQLESATLTLELLNSQAGDPAVCNQETLDILQKAKVLAVIQRSHVQRQLRSLQASRLFAEPVDAGTATWRIDA
jgi:hypothetical protein